MNTQQSLVFKFFLVLMVIVNGKRCSPGDHSFITLKITSHRNATGYRNIKGDVTIPHANDFKFDLQQYMIGKNNKSQIQLSLVLEVFAVPESRQAPPGYELAPGVGWYRLHLQPRTWEEARLACEDEGAHLAVLNSQREALVLKGIFARAPKNLNYTKHFEDNVFVGFSDAIEGEYKTIFGQSLEDAGFSDWGAGQPSNSRQEGFDLDSDCGVFWKSGKFNDVPCRILLPYICEFPL